MIEERLSEITGELPSNVKLVAVSKFHPLEDIMMAFMAGQTCFGENRPQEFANKAVQLPPEIEWHFIGHLQTNKLKMVLPYASLVQSVDSERLLEAIDTWGYKNHRVVDILLEVHIGAEVTKGGLTPEETLDLCERYVSLPAAAAPAANVSLRSTPPFTSFTVPPLTLPRVARFAGGAAAAGGRDEQTNGRAGEWKNIRICGLMGMASHTDDEERIREDFSGIKTLYDDIRAKYPEMTEFRELSIGMSDDWRIALEYGATIVRIGTAIFGERKFL